MKNLRRVFTSANVWRVLVAGLAVALTVVVVVTLTGGKEWATVQLGEDRAYLVKVADNPFERAHGLSGTVPADLGEAVGMLFVFDEAEQQTFSMRGMRYPLDILWIRHGTIVKIDYGVPAPQPGQEPKEVNSNPLKVDMVLEVPAGVVAQLGYVEGYKLNVDFDPGE